MQKNNYFYHEIHHRMNTKATSVAEYMANLTVERVSAFTKLRDSILKNIPKGFEEVISYGMIGYVVPHKLFPAGYHCDPKLPLPFISIASQKNFIVLHHLGLYFDQKLCDWLIAEYPKHCKTKIDFGKGCVRFKKIEDIPYKLIEELVKKLSVKDWISCYNLHLQKSKK